MLDYIIVDGWRYEIVKRLETHLIVEKEGRKFKYDWKNKRVERYEKATKANQRYYKKILKEGCLT